MGDELWVVRNPAVVAAGESPAIPVAALRLHPARPNPARSSATIPFSLGREGPARLDLFDVTGRRVRSLVRDAPAAPGLHEVQWDGTDDDGRAVPAGVYFVRVSASVETASRRMVLLR